MRTQGHSFRKPELATCLSLIACLALAVPCGAATPVDFYATVSSSRDTSTVSMTTDLFFTQLLSADGYTVNDKRSATYRAGLSADGTIAFYAELQEGADGWECTLNAIQGDGTVSETRKYASYYKILMDAKSFLESVLESLATGTPASGTATVPRITTGAATTGAESLAGTWTGEPQVDKVVILRGGKGFVIFRNGASMNISVSMSGITVTVTQTGRFNASYFPDLPREVALQNAASAQPVIWTLMLRDADTLSGSKTTLVKDAASATGASQGTVDVEWKRQ